MNWAKWVGINFKHIMDLDYNKRLLILIDDDNIFTTVLKTTLSKLPLSHVEVLVFENGKTPFEFITEN